MGAFYLNLSDDLKEKAKEKGKTQELDLTNYIRQLIIKDLEKDNTSTQITKMGEQIKEMILDIDKKITTPEKKPE